MSRIHKTTYSKMADGRIVDRLQSYMQGRIVEVPPNLHQEAVIRVPQNDVVRMADGRLVSELETILRAIGGGGNPLPPLNQNAIIGVNLIDGALEFEQDNGNIIKIELSDFANLDTENIFAEDNWFKDVIVDKFKSISNEHYNAGRGTTSRRYIGDRNQSSANFNGYISHIKVYCDNNAQVGDITNITMFEVEKGADRNADIVSNLLIDSLPFEVIEDENGNKCIEISVHTKFDKDTYLLIYDEPQQQSILQVINGINNPAYQENITNSNARPNINAGIVDSGARYVYNMVTYGGVSVKETLSNTFVDVNYNPVNGELDLIKADGTKKTIVVAQGGAGTVTSVNNQLPNNQGNVTVEIQHIANLRQELDNRVLIANTVNSGGTVAEADKVVKLDNGGKINANMLPAISLNEFFRVPSFNEQEVINANIQYENGDVIFAQDTQEKYLCINANDPDFNNRFIKLNDTTGTVTSINNQIGAINLSLETIVDDLVLRVNNNNVSTVAYMTDADAQNILNNLR